MIELESKNFSSVDKMLSKFKRKVKDSNLINEIKERKRHTSKKEKQRMKKKKSIYRHKRKNKIDNSKI